MTVHVAVYQGWFLKPGRTFTTPASLKSAPVVLRSPSLLPQETSARRLPIRPHRQRRHRNGQDFVARSLNRHSVDVRPGSYEVWL